MARFEDYQIYTECYVNATQAYDTLYGENNISDLAVTEIEALSQRMLDPEVEEPEIWRIVKRIGNIAQALNNLNDIYQELADHERKARLKVITPN